MDKKKLIIIGSIVLIAYIANTVVNNKAAQAIEDAIKPQLRQIEMASDGIVQFDYDNLSIKTSLLSNSISFHDFNVKARDMSEGFTLSFDEYTFSADLQALASLAEDANTLDKMSEMEAMQFVQDLTNALKDNSYDLIGLELDISIPSGTRAIWVSYDAVSPAGSGEIALRLGDSGGVETSSYISYLGSYRASGNTSMDSSTTLWKLVEQAQATCVWYGTVQLFLQNASTFTWCFSSCLNTSAGTTQTNVSSGQKALSAELTTLQLLTTSGDYDAGAVNIVYI